LRSKWPGHHEYRRLAQIIYKRIFTLWPVTKQLFRIDNEQYIFGPIREGYASMIASEVEENSNGES